MIRLITYTDSNMSISADILQESALKHCVDQVTIFGPADIDAKFVNKNKKILSENRGCGYWLWKPYIIDKCLHDGSVDDGGYLIYSDAGVEIINNVKYITDRMGMDDVFLFGNQYAHLDWCKMDAIKAICPDFIKEPSRRQVQASVIVIRNSKQSRKIVKEWLYWCQEPQLINDEPSNTTNHHEFREHRHDQAILTCVAFKYNITLHWWPAIYNGGMFTYTEKYALPVDKYPPIFHHHRFRNNDFRSHAGVNNIINQYWATRNYNTLGRHIGYVYFKNTR